MNTETTAETSLKEALQARVFSSVAHDLRTPLTCIIGSLHMLDQMKESLSAEQHDTLVVAALSEAHRLQEHITDMLAKAAP